MWNSNSFTLNSLNKSSCCCFFRCFSLFEVFPCLKTMIGLFACLFVGVLLPSFYTVKHFVQHRLLVMCYMNKRDLELPSVQVYGASFQYWKECSLGTYHSLYKTGYTEKTNRYAGLELTEIIMLLIKQVICEKHGHQFFSPNTLYPVLPSFIQTPSALLSSRCFFLSSSLPKSPSSAVLQMSIDLPSSVTLSVSSFPLFVFVTSSLSTPAVMSKGQPVCSLLLRCQCPCLLLRYLLALAFSCCPNKQEAQQEKRR